MTWVEEFCRNSGRRYPLLSGLDLDDYDGAEWQPTPTWTRSACESNVDALAAATGGLGGAGAALLSARAALAWERLDKAYEWLHAVRARAVSKAQRQVRAGIVPRRPVGLRRAQAAERRAFLRFCTLARIDRSAGWPIGTLAQERNA